MSHLSRFSSVPAGFWGQRAALVFSIFFLLGFTFDLHAQVNFGTQVVPFFSSTGCTGCHGTSGDLTLTGTPTAIYNEVITRVNLGSPTNSLILTEPSAGPPSTTHGGGKFVTWATNQPAYTTTLQWIQEGALLNPRSLSRSPANMNFSATVGGSNPTSQTLQIQNVGNGAMSWSVSGNQTWLTLSPNSGSSTGEFDNVTVGVNIAGLSAGTHTATINITGTSAANSPQTTTVTLNLSAPALSRTPSTMTFFAPVGGANPPTQTLSISNTGAGTLNWSVTDDQPWLSLSPTSGSSTGETDNVTVSASITGLAVGIYTGTITISAPGATNAPQTTTVTLNVNSGVDFLDDFTDGNADGWQPAIPSRWQVQPVNGNNAYCITTADPVDDEFSYLVTRVWSDFVMEFDARTTGTSFKNFAILFNTQNTNGPSGYYLQFDLNVNLFGQNATPLISVPGHDLVMDGQYHRIRIERQFPSIKVFGDNQLIFQLTDAVYATGFIGFTSFKGMACFDNIAITSLTSNPAPTLTAINPTSGNRLQNLNVVFTGTNFISGVTSVNAGTGITVNSVSVVNPTGPTNSTSLTANLTIADLAAIGAHSFSVTNRTPSGGTSANQTFTVNNPAPTLTTLTPNAANRSQTLDVVFTGTNFIGNVTTVNVGADITINSVTVTSATSLRANLTIGANAAIGPRNFSVTNSGPGGGTSNTLSFTINDPAPTLSSISPATGNRLQKLDVVFTGTNFSSTATTVNVGANITVGSITVTSPTSLTANLTIGVDAALGPRNFSVTNSGAGGGTSGNVTFTVNNPSPTLTSITPATGNRLQTLDVVFNGTNFINNSETKVNVGANITVNSVSVTSATSLTANLTIDANAVTGPRNFSVANNGPGGGTSGNAVFTVNNPAPILNSIAPTAGNRLQTLDVLFTGANFINGVTMVNVGAGIAINFTTFVNSSSLAANLTISATAATGPRNFSVTNSGVASASQIFSINNPAPALIGIAPASGNLGQTLDVIFSGLNFISGVTTVNLGSDITINSTEIAGATSLKVNVTIAANAATGPRNFSVTNSAPVGGNSGNQVFTVGTPTPTLAGIAPASGNRLQTLDVVFSGTNFIDGATVNADAGITVNSVRVNGSTSLTANLTIAATAATGPRNFSVTNAGGGTSNPQTFTVNNPAPTLASLAPASGIAGQTLNVTFNGTNFISGVTTINAVSGITVSSPAVTSATALTASFVIAANATAGPRSFTVTNSGPVGGTSAAQIFTVTAIQTNRVIRVVNATASPGGTVDVTVELVSQGDENAIGFSLIFDPAILSNPQARLGKDAASASLNINASQQNQGRFGILLSLAAGQKFSAGTRELVAVNFAVTPTVAAVSTPVDFGDLPIVRAASDVNANFLPVNWTAGTITFTRGFEADVSPRSTGNNNGTVTIADWVQLGRFAAGLETPRTDVNEFQRADCAPRPCGDGRISAPDWTQAGRYAAGLDTVVAACGSLSASLNLAQEEMNNAALAAVRAVPAIFTRGRLDTLLVEIETPSAVNAVGFGLTFDAKVLAFEKVRLGNGASGATLLVNSKQQANGQIGVVLALPAGQSFASGGCQLVQVIFTVLPNAAASATHIAFGSQPIAQEVVSPAAALLPTTWTAALVTLQNARAGQSAAGEIPLVFELGQNYPNPFNPSTMIHFAVPQTARVSLKIFSVLGEEIAVLVDQELPAGRYDVRWEAPDAKSGVYIYRLQAGNWSQTKKLMFMR